MQKSSLPTRWCSVTREVHYLRLRGSPLRALLYVRPPARCPHARLLALGTARGPLPAPSDSPLHALLYVRALRARLCVRLARACWPRARLLAFVTARGALPVPSGSPLHALLYVRAPAGVRYRARRTTYALPREHLRIRARHYLRLRARLCECFCTCALALPVRAFASPVRACAPVRARSRSRLRSLETENNHKEKDQIGGAEEKVEHKVRRIEQRCGPKPPVVM